MVWFGSNLDCRYFVVGWVYGTQHVWVSMHSTEAGSARGLEDSKGGCLGGVSKFFEGGSGLLQAVWGTLVVSMEFGTSGLVYIIHSTKAGSACRAGTSMG